MKSILVIWCVFALGDALSLVVPVQDYHTKFVYNDSEAHPVQLLELVADEEQLLNERVGRQNSYGSIPFGSERVPMQNYGGYVSNGYTNYPGYTNYRSYPSYTNYNRRNYQSKRRRRFGGIGSAIIV